MCRCNRKGLKRDAVQLKALIYRYYRHLMMRKVMWLWILLPTLITLMCYIMAAAVVYEPQNLQMKATEQAYATSTDLNMQFIDDDSGFTTDLALHNCTLFRRWQIGVVKKDKHGSEAGLPILQKVADDIAERYSRATEGRDLPMMTQKEFNTNEELDEYVRSFTYENKAVCFAIAWDEFDPDQNKFSFDIRMQHGSVLSPRYPQTHYEESNQNQLYLPQYANTGLLQTMTTVTAKILTEVYGLAADSFKFEILYMPMDSGEFKNDLYAEVVFSLAAFTMLAIANIGSRFISSLADVDEQRIQDMLRRAGMRKSVESSLEWMITVCLKIPLLLPIMTWITSSLLLGSTSWAFIFFQFLIFSMRIIYQSMLIKFTIDNHVVAEVVEIALEALQIAITVYAQTLVKISPEFVKIGSFFLPLFYVTQFLRLGVIADNKGIEVKLFQSNEIVNNNDLTQIMWISLYALGIKVLYLVYMLPIKIFNDPRKLWGYLYLFQPDFYRFYCCRKGHDEDSEEEDDDLGDDFAGLRRALVADGSRRKQGYDRHATIKVSMNQLHEDEQKMIEAGRYEKLEHLQILPDTPYLRLDRVSVEHGGHHIVNDVSLTVFSGETFVLIGENGAGKTAIMQTIAGLQHVHSGQATAFGMNLFKATRFMKNNFMTLCWQQPALIETLTPEQHFVFFSMFLGLKYDKQTIDRIIATYNLQQVSKIRCIKLRLQDRKMLAFALSMLGDTHIVLLDDPTQGMDQASKRLVTDIVRRNKKDRIIIIATQDMKEARALGDRIALVSHGQIKLCGTPKFYAHKFKHSLQLVFSLYREARLQKLSQLKKLIKSAVKRGYEIEEPRVDQSNLYLSLPKGISYQNLHECIDINTINTAQGKTFKHMQIKSQSLAETFQKMLESVHDDDDHHGHGHGGHHEDKGHGHSDKSESHDDNPLLKSGLNESQDGIETVSMEPELEHDPLIHETPHQMKKVSARESTWILLRNDFSRKVLTKQVVVIFCTCLLILGQETIWIFFLAHLYQPVINYNDVEQTFEEGHPPVLVFANKETPSGESTEELLAFYTELVNDNGKANTVDLEALELESEPEMSVNEVLAAAAHEYYEAMEEAAENSGHEAYAAYYIYEQDKEANYFAVGVYGNQIAAASCPTFGATMLQTLAQRVTDESELKLEFRNNLLASNSRLLPGHKPMIAEVYGTSILAAMFVLSVFQIRLFGGPIASGFYWAFLASGGHKISYVVAKYAKSVLMNFIMVTILLCLMLAQKLLSDGLWVFMLLWIFISPLFHYWYASYTTITAGLDYSILTKTMILKHFLLGILALTMSSTIVFSNGINDIVWMFYTFMIDPSALLFFVSQIGFVWEEVRVKNHQSQDYVELSPWEDILYKILLGYMIGSLVLSTFCLQRSMRQRRSITQCCIKPTQVPELAIKETDDAVVSECLKVEQDLMQPKDCVLVVENLQTFDYFNKLQLAGNQVYGEYVGRVYCHDYYTRGIYTTRGLSLSLGYQERFVILSSSRSSADDFFGVLAGQRRPSAGQIIIDQLDGIDLDKNYEQLHGVIGYQPTFDAVDENLTVQQHLTVFAGIAGIPKHDIDVHVLRMIRALSLTGLEGTKAGDMTHGQLRRLTLGMALIGRPKLVILSNPLEGVDPLTKDKLVETILSYTEDRALLMSTQDADVAQRIAHRVGIMHQGKLVALGPVTTLLETHGQGFSIQVQADMKQLWEQKPARLRIESDFLESHSEAKEVLKRIQEKLEDDTIMVGCDDFLKEYSTEGKLKALHDQIESQFITRRSAFINQLLVLNLALTIQKIIDEDYPEHEAMISSIEADLIHVELANVSPDFDVAHFNELLDEMTRDLSIAYFSIGKATLESVHAKVTSPLSAEIVEMGQESVVKSQLFLQRQRTVFARRNTSVVQPRMTSFV